ncbi:TetR/AcrR family transcriptional regulator [Dactylosporangium aurantiacum]|uniref:TetR/AcrR family transcriptional regulator n=1 Tax=Dactylosporangium aurantiacum TaxID=35754 RepID=A0A9Q9IBJ9_9ACTN|nr:TetR/AcrR family transcriptional regulator [Dactylosporangium aurantiacum]MDG6107081.1 TetR/AcrR family transcriptional regulator [Dactylosporangium aurantiacum]UWZ51380.1 TetR/AcrR family transcriptional regulator [Dactylosporangium aurantiacum]
MSKTTAVRPRGRPGGSSGAELLAVARQVFLANGYAGATMDAVAAGARISKQTLYRQYPSKDELYAAVVRDWVDRGHDAMVPHVRALLDAPDVAEGLLQLARTMQAGILSPPVLQMRNLVATEAERFPAVAADYLARSWQRNQRLLAGALARLAERGVLRVADADVAAEQFTWLVIAAPLNRVTLQGGARTDDERRLASIAAEAVTTFLSRYRSTP